jgi:hypothetical protein
MSVYPEPIVGAWYLTPEGEKFEVVAIDDDEQYIEVQYYGGEIDEFDRDSWLQMELQPVAASEDWSGPYDVAEPDDLGYADITHPSEDFGTVLNDIDREDT